MKESTNDDAVQFIASVKFQLLHNFSINNKTLCASDVEYEEMIGRGA